MFRPSRKKSAPPSKTMIAVDVEENDKQLHHGQPPTNARFNKRNTVILGVVLFLLVVLTGIFVMRPNNNTSRRALAKRNWWILVLVACVPVGMAGHVVLRSKQIHQRLIALAFVGAIACNQFPSYISSGIAATCLTVFGLATRPNNNNTANIQNKPSVVPKTAASTPPNSRNFPSRFQWSGQVCAVASALVLVVVLLFDNFCVWVVAATNYASHSLETTPPPLQDNGRLVQQYLFQTLLQLSKRQVVHLRSLFNIQWALVSACGASMVCCEMGLVQVGKQQRTLWGISMKALIVLSVARLVRVFSFLLTVLPSQVPNCYVGHFPNPPPSDWMSWILVGLQPASHGGCNDLIVSGHATVTSVLACLSTSACGNVWFTIALWLLLAMDYCIEVYEGFHYSVDMWMGALITSMLWRIMDIEPLQPTEDDNNNSKLIPLDQCTLTDMVWYALPATVAFLVVMVFPEAIVNYWVVLYCIYVVIVTIKSGFTQYTQHVLLCTLYIALAVYL